MWKKFDECCTDNPNECTLTTVEADMLKDTCQKVITAVNALCAILDTPCDYMLVDKYVAVQVAVAQLTKDVVKFGDLQLDWGLEEAM